MKPTMNSSPSSRHTKSVYLRGALALLVGTAGGWLGTAIGLPAAWLVGSALATMGLAIGTGRTWPVSMRMEQASRMIIGLYVGMGLTRERTAILAEYFVPVTLTLMATFVLSVATGLVLARLTRVSAATGLLSGLLGGVPAMTVLSKELNADARFVATMHTIRLLMVIAVSPLVVELTLPPVSRPVNPGVPGAGAAVPPSVQYLIPLLAATFGVAQLFRRLRVPAAAFIGPLFLGLALVTGGVAVAELPPALVNAAFMIVGASIGAQLDWEAVRQLGRACVPAVGLFLLLIGACVAFGYAMSRLTGIDLSVALLGTLPGGMGPALAVAIDAGLDSALVGGIQAVRLITAILAAPLLVRLARGWAKPSGPPSEKGGEVMAGAKASR